MKLWQNTLAAFWCSFSFPFSFPFLFSFYLPSFLKKWRLTFISGLDWFLSHPGLGWLSLPRDAHSDQKWETSSILVRNSLSISMKSGKMLLNYCISQRPFGANQGLWCWNGADNNPSFWDTADIPPKLHRILSSFLLSNRIIWSLMAVVSLAAENSAGLGDQVSSMKHGCVPGYSGWCAWIWI